jgi:hypothetical protein
MAGTTATTASSTSSRPSAPGTRASAYRRLRLCSNGGGYEAIPEPPSRPLDLARVRHALEAEGIAVVDARVLLIAATDPEATISRNGRILLKTRDVRAAEVAFARIEALLRSAGTTDATGRATPGG